MSRPTQARTTSTARHRYPAAGGAAPRWLCLVVASVTVASATALPNPLTPNALSIVDSTRVALAAQSTRLTPSPALQPVLAAPGSTLFDPRVNPVLAHVSSAIYVQLFAAFGDPQQREVLTDFFHGGIAGVLKKQATSRLKSPDQTQILDDFFEGGVFQSEAHRFLQLFADPDQHQFISDFVTGGLVQVVRNRLLDATSDPDQRAAIIAFFPDEVTDYRGGPIAVVQRRLIAAAKGNPVAIGVVNGIFENTAVVAVQHLIGGGPLIGTPLSELPPITPDAAVAAPHTVKVSEPAPTMPERPVSQRLSGQAPKPKPVADVEPEKMSDTDVMKTGNKVEPADVADTTRPKPDANGPETTGPATETEPTAVAPSIDAGTGTEG
ncbi:hypothetical protein [Mycobacterium antarcticum]|uniref:hypothetical protein n=1 Tax=unclassified Mycolicibacterium TaxID=2636767 RepID=UPI0024E18397|nr:MULTISPECIES: hypothetical protein [unclassified Mycolicibacterium]